MSILSRLLKRDEAPASPPPVPGRAPPPIPAAAAPGALPASEYPPSAEQTRPYTWNGEQLRPETVAALPADPVISAAAVDEAFRRLAAAAETNLALGNLAAGVNTPADQAALRSTFEDLAYDHVAPLRNLILEIHWGEAQIAWMDLVRPVLRSLRAMAAEIELLDLVAALDGFALALDRAGRSGDNAVTGEIRTSLIEAYQPLTRSLPRAFAVDGEWDRREPVIVESLLLQVPEMDPLLLARMSAVGLARLENLLRASAEDIAAVVGVPAALAEAVVDKVAEFQRCAPAAPEITGSDPGLARRALEPLLGLLELQHRCFERAAGGWSPEDVATKRQARQDRQRAYLALRGALARLGEVDLVLAIEKLPFGRRIEEIARFVRPSASPRLPGLATRGGTGDGRAHP